MLARIADKPFDDKNWLFELKFDGYRAIAEINRGSVRLYSRNGLSFRALYPPVFEELKKFEIRAIIDGEIVALDDEDMPRFQLLQQFGENPSIRLLYYVFDLLEVNGKNIRSLPLIERKQTLRRLIRDTDVIRYSDHVEQKGKKFFELVVQKDFEGIIAKRLDSEYYDGRRTGDWLKIKHHHEQEAIIIGFTEPWGGRKNFGALVLGVYVNKKLTYIGHTGTGFNERTLKELYEKMKLLEIDHSPIREWVPVNEPVTWIKPVLVASIQYSEWTQDGYMRHPVFLGLRKDKTAREVVRES